MPYINDQKLARHMLDIISNKEIIALIAICLMVTGYVRYFRAMIAGHVKPHMFSWIIWASLAAIAFAAQISDNAGAGSWVLIVSVFGGTSVAAYAYKCGEKNITRGDWVALIAALCAIPIWMATDDPFLSVILVTAIDVVGFYPTFRKSWHQPHEENAFIFVMASMQFALSVVALNHWNVVTTLYPASLVVTDAALVILILVRRKQLKPVSKD